MKNIFNNQTKTSSCPYCNSLNVDEKHILYCEDNSPLISIIIPSRVNEDILSLETLKKQTYRNIEIIIEYDEKREGVSAVRNRGARKAKGKYIFFCDNDLDLEPTCISDLYLELKEHPEASWAFGKFYIDGRPFNENKSIEIPEKETIDWISYFEGISTMSLIDASISPIFDEKMLRFNDWDLWLTLDANGYKPVFCDKFLFSTVNRNGGISNADQSSRLMWSNKLYEKHGVYVFGGVTKKNQIIKQKDQEIAKINQSLQQKDQEIASLKQAIQQKDQEISFIKSSKFWLVRKYYLLLMNLFSFEKMVSLMKTAVIIIKRDGIKIFIQRIRQFLFEKKNEFKIDKESLDKSYNYLCRISEISGLVSVIIPVYNRTIELSDSIESILNQTYKNFELIIVTDGSPKETIDIVEKYRNDSRVKIFHYLNNTGNAVRGRNKGIKEANGEFIAFQDSDDIAEHERLAVSVKMIRESGADVVYGGWRAKMDGSRIIEGIKDGQEIYSPDCDFEFLKKTCVPCQSTVMVRRSALLDVGGLKPLMQYREDHELWVRLAHNGWKFKAIKKILTNLRLHKGNNELNFKNNDRKWEELMLSEYAKTGSLQKKIAYIIPGTGISGGVAVILEHSNRLLERGYDVLLISQDFKETVDWFPNNKVPIVSLGTSDSYLLKNIDILIATGWSTVDVLDKIPASRKLYFVQSDERRFDESDDYKKNVTKTYQRNDVEYFTMARWIQDWLKSEFRHDSEYIPNGLSHCFLNKTESPKRNNGKIRVLIEGPILIPFKGVSDAMEALKGIDCDIWIVSSSGVPKKGWIYDKFFEKVPLAEMPKIYSSCDILLKMSKVESFCYPPLEMMACGGVSVIRKVTGIEEYAKDEENCLIVEDIEGARKAVERLINNPDLRKKLIENGLETVKNWNWDRSIDLLEDVIR